MRRLNIAALILLFCLQGCSLFYPQPKQNFYTLSANRESGSAPSSNGPALSIDQLQIASPYANQGFVYHLPGGTVQSDYYHLFLSAPQFNIAEQLKASLRKSGHFRTVSGYNQSQGADYILNGNIEALYGDYTNPQQPFAVVAMRIYLSKKVESSSIDKNLLGHYEKRIPLSRNSPDGLVKAWDTGLASIFANIEHDITQSLH
ncbi:MAG: ABC-type transport auxiliary lipoprotein family protein [Chthoniobacterales bacterium]